jgi:aminoglycoside phosphotransferase family enzyme/predicted kinase
MTATPALVELLLRPEAYPEHTASVELIETHISWVFLTDTFVYKLKKPVRFEFADFSTLAARHQACQDEVRLNRRLAGDVYLDVVPLHITNTGDVAFDTQGDPLDYAVKMRRLPAARRLDQLIVADRLTIAEMERLARRLAVFYTNAESAAVEASDYRDTILHHVRANRHDLLTAVGEQDASLVRRVHTAQLRLLHLYADMFESRVTAGHIIEGHGDLRPEHLCLVDPPVVFDCIEFSRELRMLDRLDELAFLAMECVALGAESVGEHVLQAYCQQSQDTPPHALWNFYKSYRACVRAKVAALRAQQVEVQQRDALLATVARRLELAETYERSFGRPTLLVVGGLMGTGKSTVAAALSEALGLDCLRTDVVRRELLGDQPASDAFGEGRYTAEHRRRVYDELFRRGEALLAKGNSVVLDGTFLSADVLMQARGLAEANGATFLALRCECPDELARQRIVTRAANNRDASDARPELFDQQKQSRPPIPADVPMVRVDTSGNVAGVLRPVYAQLRALAGATV